MQEWIFQTANLYSCIFMFPGGKLQGTILLVVPWLTTDWDSDIAGGFLFGWYPLSDAERKKQIIVPFSHMHRMWETRNKNSPSPTH